jgi:pantoate--beta-alanine ligase
VGVYSGYKNTTIRADIQGFDLALLASSVSLAIVFVQVIQQADKVQLALNNARSAGKIVGLVPTMGALHPGHIQLVNAARKACDFLVCSIFVNPTQFNESDDFNNYPRHPESDIAMLKAAGCDVVFMPEYEDVYPQKDLAKYDFGRLETRLEGAMRPGHFKGVAMVVRRFFEIVKPDKAYFGLKDFQQVLIIKQMVKQFQLETEIIALPTVRETNGLAMSSRNERLTRDQRNFASLLFESLKKAKSMSAAFSVKEITDAVQRDFAKQPDFALEYFELADPETLEPITDFSNAPHAVALIAARIGDVRLIDNMELF